MKLQISYDTNSAIEGFELIDTKYGLTALEGVIDHSSEEIYIVDCLDKMNYDDASKLLAMAVQKLRLNGNLLVNGTDLNTCCRAVSNGNITSSEFSTLLEKSTSLRNCKEVEEILLSLGLVIDTGTIKGNTYEIKSTRTSR